MPLLDIFDIEQIPDVYVKFTASQGLNGTQQGNARANIGAEAAIAAGTLSQYYRGDKSWQTLDTNAVLEGTNLYFTEARVRATPLTGYVVGTNTAVAATDSILTMAGKFQAQINAKGSGTVTSITAGTGLTGGTISTTGTIAFDTTWGDARYMNRLSPLSTSNAWTHLTLQSGIQISNHTTGSTGFPSSLGQYVVFQSSNSASDSNFGRMFALHRSYDTETYSISSPTISGTSNPWRTLWHSGNFNPSSYSLTSHTHAFSEITSKPTTLTGYGITDAVPSTRTITINGTTFDLSANRTWTIAAGTGTVTSVAVSGGTTGLTTSGGPITASGTITLAGTLAIANGGTGATTAQAAMNAFAGAVTSGLYLRGNGTNVVMSAIQAGDVPTLNQNTTGSAATLTTARTLTIGSTGKTFNGSANVSWSLAEIGAAATSHTHAATDITSGTLAAARLSGSYVITVSDVASGAVSDYNTAWTLPGTSISNGFRVYRADSAATNKPVTVDNANWLINIYSHPTGGTASYGHQLAGASNDNLYFRWVTNGSFGSWRTIWHTGNFNPAGYVLWTDVAESGASKVARFNNQGYLVLDNWIRVGINTGLYCESGHYFYTNNASTGSYSGWILRGSATDHASLMFQNVGGSFLGSVYADTTAIGFTNTANNGWRLRVDNTGAYINSGGFIGIGNAISNQHIEFRADGSIDYNIPTSGVAHYFQVNGSIIGGFRNGEMWTNGVISTSAPFGAQAGLYRLGRALVETPSAANRKIRVQIDSFYFDIHATYVGEVIV